MIRILLIAAVCAPLAACMTPEASHNTKRAKLQKSMEASALMLGTGF